MSTTPDLPRPLPGILYVVASPIGNLEDLSVRAARILRTAPLIAAEDTRSAQVLLGHVDALGGARGARRRVVSLFEGNEASRVEPVLEALAAGDDVALLSEAGTPGVSDPGARVIAAVVAAGGTVRPLPGPVACIAALVGSGLPTDRFLFVGFPPREPGARAQLFGGLRDEVATLLFYEAPDRVGETCADLAAAFGPGRRAVLARELSKVYEEFVRGTVGELAARFADTRPRGECTLVIEGAPPRGPAAEASVETQVRALLAQGLGPKDVAARLLISTGHPRRTLYQLALALAREGGTPAAPAAEDTEEA